MNWRKSGFCAANECVEVAGDDAVVAVRCTRAPAAVLTFSPGAWRAFTNRVKSGQAATDPAAR